MVQRDLIATYLLRAGALHEIGGRANGAADINAIAAQVGAAPAAALSLTRRDRKVVTVTQAIRSANFQKRVLSAYDHRCCVCGLQLELVEAAHIVPAGAALSSDDTRNGLCLCSVHHDAYDDGLLGIKPDYTVVVSSDALARHATAHRDDGANAFRSGLRPAIALPYAKSEHPDPRFLRLGLLARNWRP